MVVKLMRFQDHYTRETKTRQLFQDESSEFILGGGLCECYPANNNNEKDPNRGLQKAFNALKKGQLLKINMESLHCVVMPYADRSLCDSIRRDGYSGKRFDQISRLFNSIAKGVEYLHSKEIVHCDINDSNVMIHGIHLKLIDFDASMKIGDYVCSNSSSAVCPPEAVLISSDGSLARLVTPNDKKLKADPSFDIWSLGCVLYKMCSVDNSPLFQCDNNYKLIKTSTLSSSSSSSIDNDGNFILGEWSEEAKAQKLNKVENARNLNDDEDSIWTLQAWTAEKKRKKLDKV